MKLPDLSGWVRDLALVVAVAALIALMMAVIP